jgi:hypothetical protein
MIRSRVSSFVRLAKCRRMFESMITTLLVFYKDALLQDEYFRRVALDTVGQALMTPQFWYQNGDCYALRSSMPGGRHTS